MPSKNTMPTLYSLAPKPEAVWPHPLGASGKLLGCAERKGQLAHLLANQLTQGTAHLYAVSGNATVQYIKFLV